MSADITITDSENRTDAWDRFVLGNAGGTFFHLSGWGRVLEKTFSYVPLSCMALQGGQVVGVLPLFLVKNMPAGRSLVSTPFGVYGGICADDEGVERTLLEHAQTLARELEVKYLELRHVKPVADLPAKDLYVTFRKEISPTEDENMEAIPRKQRRMIRQGEKFDLSSRVGGRELLCDFYRIYAHSVHNLGTPVFPRSLFENLLEEFGDACRILGVFREGRMAAGVMTFFFKDEVLPYYGGALKDEFRYAVNDFMYWSLICYGAEHGYKIFDFGRSKKGTGPFDFKRHWGFEPTQLAYQYYLVNQKELPDMNPLNPKLSLPIRIWKKLPEGIANWLGPHIVKYFP